MDLDIPKQKITPSLRVFTYSKAFYSMSIFWCSEKITVKNDEARNATHYCYVIKSNCKDIFEGKM
jgi:hypothetical protein